METKLSELLDSCDRSTLVPWCWLNDKGQKCALGVAYSAAGGDDLLLQGTPPDLYSIMRKWEMGSYEADMLRFIFDDTALAVAQSHGYSSQTWDEIPKEDQRAIIVIALQKSVRYLREIGL